MDDPAISKEITIIFFLIVLNGIFAMAEMSIVASRKTRLEQLAEEGNTGAQKALVLASQPTHLLSTVQIGITLIGILTGAFGGSSLSHYFTQQIKAIPLLAPYSDILSMFLVVSAITYFSLIIGELVPKRLALLYPEPIAALLARPMSLFALSAKPIVHFLSFSTQIMLRPLYKNKPSEPLVTEEEIKVIINQGAESGVLEKAEQEMVEQIFLLGDLKVGALMTPRTQIKWLDIEDSDQQNLRVITEAKYSRFPVAKDNLDEVVGVVYTKDLLANHIVKQTLDLENSVRNYLYVSKNTPALKVLEMFKSSGDHIAFVVDEYGGLAGIITLNDILEQVIGDIQVQGQAADPDVVQRKDGTWLIDGMLPVEEFKQLFNFKELPGEEREHFQTLGGFVISYLDHIPQTGERFAWGGLIFEVVDMDRLRVDKVLITLAVPSESDET